MRKELMMMVMPMRELNEFQPRYCSVQYVRSRRVLFLPPDGTVRFVWDAGDFLENRSLDCEALAAEWSVPLTVLVAHSGELWASCPKRA